MALHFKFVSSMFRRAAIMVWLTASALVSSPVGAQAERPDAPTVQVTGGTLVGARSQGVETFLGIPYAAAPIGENRWMAPQPAQPWSGARDASHFGASCWQPVDPKGFGPWTHEYVVQGKVSEDCLFVNVWRPVQRPAGKLPVLVWIHGGAFMSGSGSVPIYDGRHLAQRGVVVVTINYRLGVLGFLAHPELTHVTAGGPPGNFGLHDQIAALKWVQANITALGGDPDRVTIAGQSAGAMSVHSLVASPLTHDLFGGAIAQSGLPTGLMAAKSLTSAQADGAAYAEAHGAGTLAALRALSPEQLNAGEGGMLRFAPIVDGVLLPADVSAMIAEGRFNDVPMLVGQNADDGVNLAPKPPATQAFYDSYVKDTFGTMGDQFTVLYPSGSAEARAQAIRAIHLDRGLASIWQWSEGRLMNGHAPVWSYLFNHIEPGPESARWRVFHSSEIPYVFGTLDASPERGFTQKDRTVSLEISSYWLNFVRSGNPNGATLPAWPRLDRQTPQMLNIGDSTESRPLLPAPRFKAYRDYLEQGGIVSMF